LLCYIESNLRVRLANFVRTAEPAYTSDFRAARNKNTYLSGEFIIFREGDMCIYGPPNLIAAIIYIFWADFFPLRAHNDLSRDRNIFALIALRRYQRRRTRCY